MLETDLSKPVSEWLIAKGFTPYAEILIPHSTRRIDIVGRKDCNLIVIELKRTLSKHVIHQTAISDLLTNYRYAAVGTQPRTTGIARCASLGLGLLSIVDCSLSVILEPKNRYPKTNSIPTPYQSQIHKILDSMTPYGIGGKPSIKGEGPAQTCYNLVATYLKIHPKANWHELFANIANHYCSPNSMAATMRSVETNRPPSQHLHSAQSHQLTLDL